MTSPPGPHSTFDARPGAESPHCPRVPRRESPPRRPEDPRQRARLTGAQVGELIHSELPRDAHDQEQVGVRGTLSQGAWTHPFQSLCGPGAACWAPGHQGSLGTLTGPPLTHTN